MARIAYVNGQYVAHAEAAVHIEDRGYQFADGVYEVVGVVDGAVRDQAPHLARLERSLHELKVARPMSPQALAIVIRQLVARNRIRNGMVYIQVTRGVAKRDHAFPKKPPKPSLVMTAYASVPGVAEARAREGIDVISMPDIRWGRCDIKTTALVANVMAKQQARDAGGYEAWLVDRDGFVTEGSSTTAWIVDREGHLVTRQLDNAILPGVTRNVLIEAAAGEGLEVHERPFTVDEAQGAREAFITAATTFVMPVVRIDGVPIGNGHPGSVAGRLRELYLSLQS